MIDQLLRMHQLDIGPTAQTRSNQEKKQIDHIFSSFALQNPRTLAHPQDPHGSDHACLAFDLPFAPLENIVSMPNPKMSATISSLIEKGHHPLLAAEEARQQHPEEQQFERTKRAATDAEL